MASSTGTTPLHECPMKLRQLRSPWPASEKRNSSSSTSKIAERDPRSTSGMSIIKDLMGHCSYPNSIKSPSSASCPCLDTIPNHRFNKKLRRRVKCLNVFFGPAVDNMLEEVRNHFGEKVAFYYAFNAHYTAWLTPPAVVGLCLFLVSSLFLSKPLNYINGYK